MLYTCNDLELLQASVSKQEQAAICFKAMPVGNQINFDTDLFSTGTVLIQR